MIIINKKNFDGNWEYIPKKGNTQSQIILSKMINNKNVIYNFNADKYDDCLGKPNSLMDELLSLDKDSFYKRIISNDSIKFIRISEDEYKKYFKKEKVVNAEKNLVNEEVNVINPEEIKVVEVIIKNN